VAWFVPPVRHDVVLDVFPKGGASITFNNTTYSEFPVTVSVPEDLLITWRVNPTRYYDFLHWTVKNADHLPQDSTVVELQAVFFTTDTIVAFLKPQDYVYFVPNAFTPNGDGINDFFLPLGNVIRPERYDLAIFDRWGQQIFQTLDPSIGWDGTSGGVPVPDGVYVYRAFVVDDIKGERYELFGHVTLFR
jgi:gliding motility-associated-like protein